MQCDLNSSAQERCNGELAGESATDIPEVLLRVGVRSHEKATLERFVKELAPLGLNGPPTVCGLGSGRPKVEESWHIGQRDS
jgi:hypothetical protein